MPLLPCTQELLLRVGVLGYVVPLLFGYDTTFEGSNGREGAPPSASASAVQALAGSASANFGAAADGASPRRDTGPAFLGLGTERSNMQVGPLPKQKIKKNNDKLA